MNGDDGCPDGGSGGKSDFGGTGRSGPGSFMPATSRSGSWVTLGRYDQILPQKLPRLPESVKTLEALDFINNLIEKAAIITDAEEITAELLKDIVKYFQFKHGSLFIALPEDDGLDLAAVIGDRDFVVFPKNRVNDRSAVCRAAMREGAYKRARLAPKNGPPVEALSLPVIFDGRTLGVVLLAEDDAPVGTSLDARLKKLEPLFDPVSKRLGLIMDRIADYRRLRQIERDARRLSRFPLQNPNPIFACDGEGRITYQNQHMTQFLRAQRIGRARHLRDLFPPDDPVIDEIIGAVGRETILANREYHIAERVLLGSISSYESAEEAFIYMQDVTEIKHLAQEMVRKNIQLIKIKEELEIQTKRAMEANRHKSEFLANMSHELRTPMNAIIGFSQVLADQLFGPMNQKQIEYAGDVIESAQHLLTLINDILDLSKIEAGKDVLEFTEFVVGDLVHASANLMSEKAHRNGISLQIDVDPRLGTIIADQRRIKQVIFNLLANSLKFTESGGSVVISARPEDDKVLFCVADSGIGIKMEDQERIFEAFQQSDGSYTKKYEGAGLGLTIVRRFVELHGGKIWVSSRPGQGSKFYFTIPPARPPWAEKPEPRSGR